MERSSSRVRTRVIRAYSHASPYPCVSLGPERDSGHRHPSSTQNDVLLSIVPPPSLRCRRLLRTAERRAGLSRLQRGNGVSGAGVGRGGGGCRGMGGRGGGGGGGVDARQRPARTSPTSFPPTAGGGQKLDPSSDRWIAGGRQGLKCGERRGSGKSSGEAWSEGRSSLRIAGGGRP